jgi:glycosyltransferase involved in cell wall biosynthesis
MRIGVNLFMLQPHVGGIAHYVMSLLRAWPRFAEKDELVLYSFSHNDRMLRELPENARRREVRLNAQEEIPSCLDDIDVYFCPFGSLYPRPVRIPSVVTIVDIQERFFPGFFSNTDVASRLHHYDGSLCMADRAITISAFSRRTLEQVLHIPGHKIDVVHLCVDHLPEHDTAPDIMPREWDHRFVFFPANDWPHKNHSSLIHALALLKKQGVGAPCIMTGTQQNRWPDIQHNIERAGLKDDVQHLGQVNRAEMAWLFRHARVLAFPSLFEGFGIPVVEAMQCGLPVACSHATSLPEVAGKAALYFHPLKVPEIAKQLEQLLHNDDLRNECIQTGHEQQQQFSEEQLVKRHQDVFRHAQQQYTPLKYPVHYAWARWRRAFPRKRLPAAQRKRAQAMLHEQYGPDINTMLNALQDKV